MTRRLLDLLEIFDGLHYLLWGYYSLSFSPLHLSFFAYCHFHSGRYLSSNSLRCGQGLMAYFLFRELENSLMTRDVTLDYFLLKAILVPVWNDKMSECNTRALCSKYQVSISKIKAKSSFFNCLQNPYCLGQNEIKIIMFNIMNVDLTAQSWPHKACKTETSQMLVWIIFSFIQIT